MHERTKHFHKFSCDTCGQVAGQNPYEDEALAQAREVAKAEGWRWNHPGWRLTCPKCKRLEVKL